MRLWQEEQALGSAWWRSRAREAEEVLEEDLIAKFSKTCYNSCKSKETASNEARSNHNIAR